MKNGNVKFTILILLPGKGQDALAKAYIEQINRRNKMTAEVVRLRRANTELQKQLYAVTGSPIRLMLPAPAEVMA